MTLRNLRNIYFGMVTIKNSKDNIIYQGEMYHIPQELYDKEIYILMHVSPMPGYCYYPIEITLMEEYED